MFATAVSSVFAVSSLVYHLSRSRVYVAESAELNEKGGGGGVGGVISTAAFLE